MLLTRILSRLEASLFIHRVIAFVQIRNGTAPKKLLRSDDLRGGFPALVVASRKAVREAAGTWHQNFDIV